MNPLFDAEYGSIYDGPPSPINCPDIRCLDQTAAIRWRGLAQLAMRVDFVDIYLKQRNYSSSSAVGIRKMRFVADNIHTVRDTHLILRTAGAKTINVFSS